MKLDQYLKTTNRVGSIKVLYLIMAATLFSSAAVAEEPSSSGNLTSAKNDQIRIEADKLVTNQAEKYAEFSGNVRASQGTFLINADHLRIYYQAASDSAAGEATGQESIQQVVATGNVTLSTGKYTGETDRAEYDLDTQVLVLIGESSVVKSERNILTGSKIIVDRKTGEMSVQSNPQERVKAIFYPDESSKKQE